MPEQEMPDTIWAEAPCEDCCDDYQWHTENLWKPGLAGKYHHDRILKAKDEEIAQLEKYKAMWEDRTCYEDNDRLRKAVREMAEGLDKSTEAFENAIASGRVPTDYGLITAQTRSILKTHSQTIKEAQK